MSVQLSSVRGVRATPDGRGCADDASRRTLIDNIMFLLPVYM